MYPTFESIRAEDADGRLRTADRFPKFTSPLPPFRVTSKNDLHKALDAKHMEI